MKKLILLALVTVLVMTSTLGCNAAKGVGKDIENTGKNMQR